MIKELGKVLLKNETNSFERLLLPSFLCFQDAKNFTAKGLPNFTL
jgi:hypothetical protein